MKKNFIIIMGSDGAGKSTIAHELSKVLGYPVEHHGPPKSYTDGMMEYYDCIETTDYNVIKDRFHEGEKIFAPIYRGYEADYFDELEEHLKSRFNAFLILVEPPFEVIERRLKKRGEDFVRPEHYKYCYNKVREIYDDSTLRKMVVDTSVLPVEKNVEKIVKTLFTV